MKMLSKEVERNLIISYWLSETEYLECLEDYLRCEIEDGEHNLVLNAILEEIRNLVLCELNERARYAK